MKKKLYYTWDEVPVIVDLPFAARIFGVSPESLEKRCRNGKFPAFKDGGQWRVTKHAIFKYIEDNSVMPGYAPIA